MTTKVYRTTFRLRRGDAAEWAEVNPILQAGEPGFEIDTFGLKIGNGKDHYNDLPYINNGETDEIGAVVNKSTHYDFPEVGDPNVIYKAEKERQIYQWDSETSSYVTVGPMADVSLIHGGSASGNS